MPACRSGCSTKASATPATTCGRIGEEGLFELLVEQNMGVLAEAQFDAIFTTDPHSLNTLRNEYPQYGLDKPVYHYTELLADLVVARRDLAAARRSPERASPTTTRATWRATTGSPRRRGS